MDLEDVKVTVELDQIQEDRITALELENAALRLAIATNQDAIVAMGEAMRLMQKRIDTVQTYVENGWTL